MFMSTIVLLCRTEFLGQEACGVACLPLWPLSVDGTDSILGAVAYDPDWVRVVHVDGLQHRSPTCKCFDWFKAFVVQWCPDKLSAIANTCRQRQCVCGDIWHKVCQILHESEEPLDFVKIMGLSPVPYLLHFISAGIQRVWSGSRTKEVYVCVSPMTPKGCERVMHDPLCKKASQIRWEIPDSWHYWKLKKYQLSILSLCEVPVLLQNYLSAARKSQEKPGWHPNFLKAL